MSCEIIINYHNIDEKHNDIKSNEHLFHAHCNKA